MVAGTSSGRHETVLRSSHLHPRGWRQGSQQIFFFLLLLRLLLIIFFLLVAFERNRRHRHRRRHHHHCRRCCRRLLYLENPPNQVIISCSFHPNDNHKLSKNESKERERERKHRLFLMELLESVSWRNPHYHHHHLDVLHQLLDIIFGPKYLN